MRSSGVVYLESWKSLDVGMVPVNLGYYVRVRGHPRSEMI